MTPQEKMFKALNRLGKWRTIFAGWQIGTRAKSDPEAAAIRDHREATMILRAETTALTALLIKKGVFTKEEYADQVVEEANELSAAYERFFPGFSASDIGMVVGAEAAETTKGWKP